MDEKKLSSRLEAEYKEARGWMEPARKRIKEAREFYDGKTWNDEQRLALEEAERPAGEFNQIFKAINNLCGRQRDSRLNFKALPKGADDVLKAAGVTRGLEHLEDATGFGWTESESFKDALFGIGWVELGHDDTDPTREAIFCSYVPDDEMLFDPYGRRKDLSDFRYLVRLKEVDLDVAIQGLGKQHEAKLRQAVLDRKNEEYGDKQGDYNNRDDGRPHAGRSGQLADSKNERERVLLREHQYWEIEDYEFLDMPNGDRIDWDANDPTLIEHVMAGGVLKRGKKRCYYTALMAGSHILTNEKDNLPFNRFRYVALWGFRDRAGRPFGVVEPMKWPQRELNVNRSRLIEAIRNRGVFVDPGAQLPPGMTMADIAKALARANFALPISPASVQIVTDQAQVGDYAGLMETSRREIDDVIGLNEAAYGDKGNEKSGKAIQARIAQQGLNLGEMFDNWRYFRLQVGEMLLALALKYWSPEKWARIIEASVIQEHQGLAAQAAMRGAPLPQQVDLSWIRPAVAGINSLLRFDVKIIDQAETTTERAATMEQAIQLAGMMPDPAKAAVVPDIIRMSDFEGKEEMASKAEQALAPPPPPMPMPPPEMAGPPMGPPPLPPEMMPPPPGPEMVPGFLLPPEGMPMA